MELSDFKIDECIIVRDGNFRSLGSVCTQEPWHLVYANNARDIKKIIENPSISCVITTDNLVLQVPEHLGLVTSKNPKNVFYQIQLSLSCQAEFSLDSFKNTISSAATIHPSAQIGSHSIHIGENVVIGKNVVIHEQTIIDEGVIIRAGSIIGNARNDLVGDMNPSDWAPTGGVYIHREVEIHANTIIDRALFKGYTEIGRQTKIDNLVHISQGTIIGNQCLVVACADIGDFVVIGDDTWVGPNSTLADQIQIGNRVYITLGSIVSRDICDNMLVKDNYMIDRQRFKKIIR